MPMPNGAIGLARTPSALSPRSSKAAKPSRSVLGQLLVVRTRSGRYRRTGLVLPLLVFVASAIALLQLWRIGPWLAGCGLDPGPIVDPTDPLDPTPGSRSEPSRRSFLHQRLCPTRHRHSDRFKHTGPRSAIKGEHPDPAITTSGKVEHEHAQAWEGTPARVKHHGASAAGGDGVGGEDDAGNWGAGSGNGGVVAAGDPVAAMLAAYPADEWPNVYGGLAEPHKRIMRRCSGSMFVPPLDEQSVPGEGLVGIWLPDRYSLWLCDSRGWSVQLDLDPAPEAVPYAYRGHAASAADAAAGAASATAASSDRRSGRRHDGRGQGGAAFLGRKKQHPLHTAHHRPHQSAEGVEGHEGAGSGRQLRQAGAGAASGAGEAAGARMQQQGADEVPGSGWGSGLWRRLAARDVAAGASNASGSSGGSAGLEGALLLRAGAGAGQRAAPGAGGGGAAAVAAAAGAVVAGGGAGAGVHGGSGSIQLATYRALVAEGGVVRAAWADRGTLLAAGVSARLLRVQRYRRVRGSGLAVSRDGRSVAVLVARNGRAVLRLTTPEGLEEAAAEALRLLHDPLAFHRLLAAALAAAYGSLRDVPALIGLPQAAPPAQKRFARKLADLMQANTAPRWSTPDRTPHQYQWLWDSCFHALGMNLLNHTSAWQQLQGLLRCQASDGFIPHFCVHARPAGNGSSGSSGGGAAPSSSMTQPPLLAWAVWDNYLFARNKARLEWALPRLMRFLDWLSAHRSHDNGTTFFYVHGFESGMDNSPRFDASEAAGCGAWRGAAGAGAAAGWADAAGAALAQGVSKALGPWRRDARPGGACGLLCSPHAASVDLCALAAREMAHVALMLRELGRAQEAAAWRARARAVSTALVSRLWHPRTRMYADVARGPYGWRQGVSALVSVAGLMPLLAGPLPWEQLTSLINHIRDGASFGTRVPLPSVAASGRGYGDDMWRGPMWVNTNYMAARGLLEQRSAAAGRLARELMTSTVEEVARWYASTGTVYEYYDSRGVEHPGRLGRKGARGLGGVRDYHWTAALSLRMMAELAELERQQQQQGVAAAVAGGSGSGSGSGVGLAQGSGPGRPAAAAGNSSGTSAGALATLLTSWWVENTAVGAAAAAGGSGVGRAGRPDAPDRALPIGGAAGGIAAALAAALSGVGLRQANGDASNSGGGSSGLWPEGERLAVVPLLGGSSSGQGGGGGGSGAAGEG